MANNNNYGQDSYGATNDAIAPVAGYMNPWIALAQAIISPISKNQGAAIDAGHEQQQKITGGKNINSEHSSPFGAADWWGKQIIPGAEKLVPGNWKPLEVAPGSVAQTPSIVNSGSSPYASSASPWANIYAQYRR